jgi:hypothetical protein
VDYHIFDIGLNDPYNDIERVGGARWVIPPNRHHGIGGWLVAGIRPMGSYLMIGGIRKNREFMLSIGMLCLVGAIALKRFGGGIPHVAFIEGMLLGISVVLNLAYLVHRRSRG